MPPAPRFPEQGRKQNCRKPRNTGLEWLPGLGPAYSPGDSTSIVVLVALHDATHHEVDHRENLRSCGWFGLGLRLRKFIDETALHCQTLPCTARACHALLGHCQLPFTTKHI